MNRLLLLATVAALASFAAACGAIRSVIPAANAPSYFSASPFLSPKNYVIEYPVSQTPSYIATGSDGNLWFTTASSIVQITPTGTQTAFSNGGGFATHIAAGKKGFLWFTDLNGNIGEIAVSGTISTFAVPGAGKTFDIAKGPDGNMWFTEQSAHAIGKITPAGSSTLFSIPSGATPNGITAGPDGNLWFSATGGPNGMEFGKVTTAGTVTEFPIAPGTPGTPGAMTPGPDGNLYATDSVGGVFAVTTSGVSTYFPTSFQSNFENGIAVGPDKQIWISPGDSADDLTEFSTSKHTFGKAAMVPSCPNGGSPGVPRGLTLGPDGDVWFVTEGCTYVGVYEEKIDIVGVRLTGEQSFNDPSYGFELGYFDGTKSTTSQTVSLNSGESVRFQNVDSVLTHTASFLGDASQNSAPWPSTFDGSSTQSPAGTVISTIGFSTGPLARGKSSLVYETGIPGFYMFGCAFHYDSNEMRTVIIVH